MKAFYAKQCGNTNPLFDVKHIHCFATLDTIYRRSLKFSPTNLFGTALHTFQKTNAQTHAVPFIECYHTGTEAFVKVNLKDYIEKIRTHLDLDVIPFSIFIDATKISRGIYLPSANN